MKARKKILRKKSVAITPPEEIVAKKKSSRVAKKNATSRKNSTRKIPNRKTISKSTSSIPEKAAAEKLPTSTQKLPKKNSRTTVAKTPAKVARKKITRKKAVPSPKPPPSKTSIPEIPRAEIIAAKPAAAPISKSPERKMPAKVPAILLEGDSTPSPSASGPGKRYVLGSTPAHQQLETETHTDLPESYGTQNLLFTARDPHWFYAHWDISREQQQRFNLLSVDRHLVLRIHSRELSSKPEQEIHVHPESRHWFVHVNRGGEKYIAELGYYSRSGRWTTISISSPALTPPDAVAENTSADFATLPLETPMANLLSLVEKSDVENAPLAETHSALPEIKPPKTQQIPAATNSKSVGPRNFPESQANHIAQKVQPWTPAQERALAEMVSMDHVRRVWAGSMEIAELIRGEVAGESAFVAAQSGFAPTSPVEAPGGISSAQNFSAPSSQKNFWFNVNAELVIYGATERDANVTIGGRKIRLRPDGSFSYRFALPDGKYELPIAAVSADGTDGRGAEIKFARETEFRGDVGAHPQDSALKNPSPENIS